MTYAPATLVALARYWVEHDGDPEPDGVNLGIVGDTDHVAKGYSYHLGKDQLAAGAYSIKTARDRAGLTNAASAIDLGRLEGSLAYLREFSAWLVARARANAPGTSDIREIIYTADGKTVLRWDRERGYASAPRAGEADDSHLTHTHISFYRDAESRDHTTAFRPYFEEGQMSVYVRRDRPGRFTIPAGKAVRGWQPAGDGWKVVKTWDAQPSASSGPYDYILGRVSGTAVPSSLIHVPAGFFAGLFVATSEVDEVADPPAAPAPDTSPFTQAQLDAAVKAERERVKAAITAAVGGIT